MSKRFSPTERLGVNAVEKIFLKEFEWIPRSITETDVGIDMTVETVDKDPNGKFISIQIKSGKSFFKEKNEKKVTYRGKDQHLKYWLNHSLPVLLVLYNPNEEIVIWQYIQEKNITRTEKGWKTDLPLTNVLSLSFKDEFEKIVDSHNYSFDNFNFDLRSINQKLQSKNILESLYTITNYFDGLLVLPRNIISKLHPFKLENHSSARHSNFSITSSNKELVDFFKSVKKVKKKLIYVGENSEILGDKQWKNKIESILTFFKYNRINHLYLEGDSNERVCIHNLYNYTTCNCERCNFSRMEFKNSILLLDNKLRFTENNFFKLLRQAYTFYQFGLFEKAFNIYVRLSKKSKDKKKYIVHFLCEYNLSKLGISIGRNYFAKNRKTILTRCFETNLPTLIAKYQNYAVYNLNSEAIEFMRYINQGKFINSAFYTVSELLDEIKGYSEFDKKGNWANHSKDEALQDEVAHLSVFIDGNLIIYNNFLEYQKIIDKSIEATIILHEIQNQGSSKIDQISDYHLGQWVFFANTKKIKQIFDKYQIKKLRYDERSHSGFVKFSTKLSNLVRSKREIIRLAKKNDKDRTNYFLESKFNLILSNAIVLTQYLTLSDKKLNSILKSVITLISNNDIVRNSTIDSFKNLIYKVKENISLKNLKEILKLKSKEKNINKWKSFNVTFLYSLPILRKERREIIKSEIIFYRTNIENTSIRFNDIFSYLPSCTKIEKKRFGAIIKKRLKHKFDQHLFYRAVMADMISFRTFETQYLQSIPKRKDEKSYREIFLGLSDPIHYRLNEFINIAYKIKLNLNLKKYQKIKIENDYYMWLFNPEEFDYSKFKIEWLLAYQVDNYFRKFSKIVMLKKLIAKYLRTNNNDRLKFIYLEFFN